MFADTQTITINAVDKVLSRIRQDNYSSEYLLQSTTEEFRLFLRNTTVVIRSRGVTMFRHNAELIHTTYGASPAPDIVRKVFFTFENQRGDTLADPVKTASGLLAWAVASTNANLTKLVNFES